MTWWHGVLVAVFGGGGAATRFVVDGVIRQRWPTRFPLGTWVINVSGSLLIGLVLGAQQHLGLADDWRVALATGWCGGYTTFSTAMVETVRLIEARSRWLAVSYAAGMLLAAVVAAALGIGIMALAGR